MAGPARHRQEEVVVLVGVPVPPPQHASELLVQVLVSRVRKETGFVGHRIRQVLSAAGKETRRRAWPVRRPAGITSAPGVAPVETGRGTVKGGAQGKHTA